MRTEARPWLWLALPAVAMTLGWGLRGYIAGGPLGAMLPGAMLGLVLVVLLGEHHHAAWIAACSAVGFGFGGQMTYGQTVGLSLQPETYWWAMLGFTLKGGAWGLGGGALIGTALMRDREGWSGRRWLAALLLMLAASWVGWKLVNEPKLVYFSDPMNKPRAEGWAGLLAGMTVFLLAAARGPHRRLAWRFALWAAAGGAAGFPLGAAFQVWGRGLEGWAWLDWWKVMEFTLGAGLGLGCGVAAWRSRRELAPGGGQAAPERASWMGSLVLAAALAVVCIGIEEYVPLRFNYSIAGALVLAAALRQPLAARYIAVTVPIIVVVQNLVRNKPWIAGAGGWAVVACVAALAAAWTTKEQDARVLFLGLTWSAFAVSLLKTFVPPPLAMPGQWATEGAYVVMAVLCSLWIRAAADDAAPKAAVAS